MEKGGVDFFFFCYPCSAACIQRINLSHRAFHWLSLICPVGQKCGILRDLCNVQNKIIKYINCNNLQNISQNHF